MADSSPVEIYFYLIDSDKVQIKHSVEKRVPLMWPIKKFR